MSSLTVVKRPPPRKPNAPRGGQLTPEVIITDRNDRIREIAYFLWLEEGCPEGEAQRHWLAAETIVEAKLREGKRIDEDSVLIDQTFSVQTPLEAMSPIAVEPDFTRRYIETQYLSDCSGGCRCSSKVGYIQPAVGSKCHTRRYGKTRDDILQRPRRPHSHHLARVSRRKAGRV